MVREGLTWQYKKASRRRGNRRSCFKRERTCDRATLRTLPITFHLFNLSNLAMRQRPKRSWKTCFLIITPPKDMPPEFFKLFTLKRFFNTTPWGRRVRQETTKWRIPYQTRRHEDHRSITNYHPHYITTKVNITLHLNIIKGIIHHPELQYLSEAETRALLHRQMIKKGDQWKDVKDRETLSSVALTFALPELPPTVILGWDSVCGHTYIPLPIRCLYCSKYGHIGQNCTNPQTWSSCGEPGHWNSQCTQDTREMS